MPTRQHPPNNNTAIAESFADSFASVFSIDDGNIPPCIPPQTISSPIQFDPRGVLTQLTKLDPRKGAGPDELSLALLKYLAHYIYIYEPLTKVFQYTFTIHPRHHKTGKQQTLYRSSRKEVVQTR
ncbi:hypothetical protein EB796_013194 [Bugula neritina]|uniref:Uncharacterized protein n=1 Tax=Bugula neritina TaxID=10212 RepID=A0A7J7JST3_BUGNE|nr:hypothetical protein EB796_013194 [Bugula neritina]